ncbi:MAG: methyltransferase domain-containing protein [Proteobacteria bacterium]|nr:MAG: methyltransferase domain-containing protein [Pseudomonadota bacterium]
MSYKKVLQRLHSEADTSDAALRATINPEMMQKAIHSPRSFYGDMKDQYLAIDETFGRFLYMSARMMRAKTIVEFGTSFGISTIYLAQALKENGGGRLITTEYEESKIEVARKNVSEAGLSAFVEFRQGDALETLKNFGEEIDLLFLDGAKNLYVPLLELLNPYFRAGTFIASDNSKMSPDFVSYLRNEKNGYCSTDISSRGDNELAIWTSVQ